jgi:tetratricopeptide (TPR) repeat protein
MRQRLTDAQFRELVRRMAHLPEDRLEELIMLFARLGELRGPEVTIDLELLRQVRARAKRQQWHARELCDQLLRVHPKVRMEEAEQDRRYHTTAVMNRLLKRAQAEVLNDPKVSRHLAELALAIGNGMYPSHTVPHRTMRDYFALAHAQIGNVCRLHCEWNEAHQRFNHAQGLLLDGAGDLEIHAHVQHLYGTLLKDQRQFSLALAYLDLAQQDYRQLGRDHEVGLVLITTSVLYRDMGASERALQAHMQACDLLDETRTPVLAAAAWNNLAILLCDRGQYEEAARVLENLPSVYDLLPAGSPVQLDLTWVRGMVAQGMGELRLAEDCYLAVHDGYERRNDRYSSARVSLDLLRAYFTNGRLSDVERFAVTVYRALKDQPLEAEAHEVFRILTAARTQRHLVQDALARLATYLAKNPFPGKRSPTTEP